MTFPTYPFARANSPVYRSQAATAVSQASGTRGLESGQMPRVKAAGEGVLLATGEKDKKAGVGAVCSPSATAAGRPRDCRRVCHSFTHQEQQGASQVG